MTVSITVPLVVSNGSIDQAASESAFRTALLKRVAEQETEVAEIADATLATFAEHKGRAITMPALAGMVCARLNVQPENFSVLSDRVLDYVRSNSQGRTVNGQVENPESLFVISKGKGGGTRLRADIVAPTDSE